MGSIRVNVRDDIDYSDIAPLTDEFFEKAVLRVPATQAKNFVQLDPDVMEWFQAQGEEYKNLINLSVANTCFIYPRYGILLNLYQFTGVNKTS